MSLFSIKARLVVTIESYEEEQNLIKRQRHKMIAKAKPKRWTSEHIDVSERYRRKVRSIIKLIS